MLCRLNMSGMVVATPQGQCCVVTTECDRHGDGYTTRTVLSLSTGQCN